MVCYNPDAKDRLEKRCNQFLVIQSRPALDNARWIGFSRACLSMVVQMRDSRQQYFEVHPARVRCPVLEF